MVGFGCFWLSAVLSLSCQAALAVAEAPSTLEALQAELNAQLDRAEFVPAHWGVQVASLDTGKILFQRNPRSQFIPASNTKLFTAALALDQLGPSYQIRTSIYATRKPDRRGVIAGDLILYGRGDPVLGASDLPSAVDSLANALVAAGVRRVEGALEADESFFDVPETAAGWMVEDLSYAYSPEISALTYRGNVVDWVAQPAAVVGQPAIVRFVPPCDLLSIASHIQTSAAGTVGSTEAVRVLGGTEVRMWGQLPVGGTSVTNTITVHRPAQWFGQELLRSLRSRGIRVGGGLHTVGAWERKGAAGTQRTQDWVELAAIDSPPVSELVERMMKPSDNLQAHLLFLQVGAKAPVAPPMAGAAASRETTVEDRAATAMKAFLRRVLGREPTLQLEEGSGLSRRHAVSPEDVVTLLRFMSQHPAASAFQQSLPIAGRDGTLRGRMRGTAAEGNLRAKTGTLRGVSSLSGYVRSAAGERLVFSFLLNQYVPTGSERSAREELDFLGALLASFRGTSRE